MIRVFVLFVGLVFSACSDKAYESGVAQAMPVMAKQSYDKTTVVETNRIITKNASIKVEVKSIEKAQTALSLLVDELKGHIVNAQTYEDGDYHASIKVPASTLESALEKIASLGEKISQNINQHDVTDSFVDSQARMKNLILFRDKMKKLLKKAKKIEDVLRIEAELNRVQTQIDSIEGRLKYLKNAVDMSLIQVTFEEETIYGPLGYLGNGLWWTIKKLFVLK
ncbi:MAG TPA: DUF4349 domain-containing protein [Campylobacterales bacterium]|nr:DUF4349 domain-containing protein [Campylobacterales bacterium]